jgi:lambda family phage portal protein
MKPLRERARIAMNTLRGREPGEAIAGRLRAVERTAIAAPVSDRELQRIATRAEQLRRYRDIVAQIGAGVWKGAESSRLTMDWGTSTLPADQEIIWDLRKLRNRARDLSRNSGTIHHFGNMVAANVVGPDGIGVQPKVRTGTTLDTVTNQRIRDAWTDWAEGRVTVDKRHTWLSFQHLALKTLVRDGELFVRIYRDAAMNAHGLALQIIDADYVDENYNVQRAASLEVRLGVEVDDFGAPTAYHVWKEQRLPYIVPVRRERVPADQILHVYMSERPNQTRGVSWLAPIMFPHKMLGGYIESELVAARIAASKMGFFTTKDGAVVGEMAAGSAPAMMDANPGTAEALSPGWGFEQWDPQHPSTAFPSFVKAALREVASGIDVSYNSLANDLEGVNFSSIRAGLLNERDWWKLLQTFWIGEIVRPVYREWLGMALLRGTLALESRDFRLYTAVGFMPRGWPWVDPLKDVEAAATAIGQGMTSRTRALAEQGVAFPEVIEELSEEQAIAKEKGVVLWSPPRSTQPDPGDATGPGGDGAAAGDNPSQNGLAHAPARRFLT